MQDRKIVGEKIAMLRKDKDWTQADLAERLNVSNKTVSKWECGRSLPDISLLPSIAAVFGISSDELLGIINEPAASEEIQGYSGTLKYSLNKKGIRYWEFYAALFLCLAPFVTAVIANLWMPARVPMHYTNGVIDRWGNSGEMVIMGIVLSVCALIPLTVFRFFPAKLATKTQCRIILWGCCAVMGLVFAVMQVVFTVKAFNTATAAGIAAASSYLQRMSVFVLLPFFLLSLPFPLTKPNLFLGIRISATLSSEEVWVKTHEFAGYVMPIITAFGLIVCSFVQNQTAQAASMAACVILPILTTVPAAFYFKKRCSASLPNR